MSEDKKTDAKKFHYLEVNRGRYICLQHGGFCDEKDGNTKECPLCAKGTCRNEWRVNNISRAITLMNGHQERAKSKVALLLSVSTALTAFSYFESKNDSTSILDVWDSVFLCAITLGIICLLIATSCFIAAMKSVPVILEKRPAFQKKTLSKFEVFFANQIKKVECWDKWGMYLSFAGSGLIILSLLLLIVPQAMVSKTLSWLFC